MGTGRNLPYYPSGTSVTGIDLSSSMISIARTRVTEQAAALQIADAQHLPFIDNSFDTVVATLALCSIPDDAAATREITYEHEAWNEGDTDRVVGLISHDAPEPHRHVGRTSL